LRNYSYRNGQISGYYGGEYETAVFWDVAPCSLVEVYRRFRALMIEAVRISETSVNFY
jgi:hypothetical protein